MKRGELIKYCKFYKGENDNPYEPPKNKDEYYKSIFWSYEWKFVHRYLGGEYKDINPAIAIEIYLKGAFNHWSNFHEAMDDGELIRKKYNELHR